MGDDPVPPIVTYVAVVELGQLRCCNHNSLGEGGAGLVDLPGSVLRHGQRHAGFHIAEGKLSRPGENFPHPLGPTGKMALAILGQALGKLKKSPVRMVLAGGHRRFGPDAKLAPIDGVLTRDTSKRHTKSSQRAASAASISSQEGARQK